MLDSIYSSVLVHRYDDSITDEPAIDLTACEGVKFSHNQFSRSTRIKTNPTSAEIETTANQGLSRD